MSGVYISGLEMPTGCGVTVTIYADGRVVEYLGYGEKRTLGKAIPAPDHGRLVDADALADVFRGHLAMTDSFPFSQLSFAEKSRRDEQQNSLAEVLNAPTIIPADKEGET